MEMSTMFEILPKELNALPTWLHCAQCGLINTTVLPKIGPRAKCITILTFVWEHFFPLRCLESLEWLCFLLVLSVSECCALLHPLDWGRTWRSRMHWHRGVFLPCNAQCCTISSFLGCKWDLKYILAKLYWLLSPTNRQRAQWANDFWKFDKIFMKNSGRLCSFTAFRMQ